MGYCAICHRYTELTKEHIPPQSYLKYLGLNDFNVYKNIHGKLEAKKFAKGHSDYLLCQRCNNLMGSYYMGEYGKDIKEFFDKILKSKVMIRKYEYLTRKEPDVIVLKDFQMNVLRFLKANLAMACDYFNPIDSEKSFINYKDFLLNKSNIGLSNKYDLFLFVGVNNNNVFCCKKNILGGVFFYNYPIGLTVVKHTDILSLKDPKDKFFKKRIQLLFGYCLNDLFASHNKDKDYNIKEMILPLYLVTTHCKNGVDCIRKAPLNERTPKNIEILHDFYQDLRQKKIISDKTKVKRKD